ncbi:MAG TPA: hypothetical protein VME46_00290 [Acidimicrobiales bacterium]|nr:hypothetical protein [Acidimicrobiales bacterium]
MVAITAGQQRSWHKARDRLASLRRVVIWGHPLHSHTHSYIHAGYASAFRYLGAETLWVDSPDALALPDMRGTLFFSEGQAVSGMPLRKDCLYVLHNVDGQVYEGVQERVLALQVLTNEVRERARSGRQTQRVNDYTYVESGTGVTHLYQPWATDLLPEEIDFDVPLPRPWPKGRLRRGLRKLRTGPLKAVWVGTIGGGKFGNENEVGPFRAACDAAGIQWVHKQNLSRASHVRLVRASLLAPAIVGSWQLENGYVPCRLFKNVSYGRLALTNSPWAQALFEEPVLCRTDTAELFAVGAEQARDRDAILAQMREVKDRHTYVNRVATIMEYLP